MKLKACLLALMSLVFVATSTVSANDEVWLDVRTAAEYQAGHLPGAVNLSHELVEQQISTVIPDKNTSVKLYCKSGRRAGLALDVMKKLGYADVENKGGYQQLLEAQKVH